MTIPLPPAAIDAAAPTSRSTFRLLAKSVGASNREADTLRHALLAKWDDAGELSHRLRSLDRSDPDGDGGVEARLAVWFAPGDPGDGQLVGVDDPVLTDLSADLAERLAQIRRS